VAGEAAVFYITSGSWDLFVCHPKWLDQPLPRTDLTSSASPFRSKLNVMALIATLLRASTHRGAKSREKQRIKSLTSRGIRHKRKESSIPSALLACHSHKTNKQMPGSVQNDDTRYCHFQLDCGASPALDAGFRMMGLLFMSKIQLKKMATHAQFHLVTEVPSTWKQIRPKRPSTADAQKGGQTYLSGRLSL
jgi:hypothetical protein